MKPGLFLDDYYAQRGITETDLISAIVERVAGRAEVAFISGSLIEGLGTRLSDIDVYVLAEVIPKDERRIDFFRCGQVVVDFEWWPLGAVQQLIAQLEDMPSHDVRDPRDTLKFSPYDRELLHRLLIGKPVMGRPIVRSLQNRINPASLSRLLLDRALIRINNAHLDIVGLLEYEDFETTAFLSQALTDYVIDVLLSATGNTNPEEKWRLAKLRRLAGTNWDEDLPGGRLTESPADTYLRLRFPHNLRIQSMQWKVAECVRFANRIMPWAQERFFKGQSLQPVVEETRAAKIKEHPGLSVSEERTAVIPANSVKVDNEPALPRLSISARVLYEQDGLKLLDVDTGRGWDINSLTHEALLLFDGRTSMRTAVAQLAESTIAPAHLVRQAVEDLCVVFSTEGLLDDSYITS